MKITLLGTGSPVPSTKRASSGYLIETGSDVIVMDHGPGAFTRLMQAGKRTRNLGDYLKIFDLTLSVLQQKEALYRTAYELVEDCAEENVRHLEVRYSPILHRERGLSLEQAIRCPEYGAPLVVLGAPLTIDADSFKTADGNLEASLKKICDAVHAQPLPAKA